MINRGSNLLWSERRAAGVETLEDVVDATLVFGRFVLFDDGRMKYRLVQATAVLIRQTLIGRPVESLLNSLEREDPFGRTEDALVEPGEREEALLAIDNQKFLGGVIFGEEYSGDGETE